MAFQWSSVSSGSVIDASHWEEVVSRIRSLESLVEISASSLVAPKAGNIILGEDVRDYKAAVDRINTENTCRSHNAIHYNGNRTTPHYSSHKSGDHSSYCESDNLSSHYTSDDSTNRSYCYSSYYNTPYYSWHNSSNYIPDNGNDFGIYYSQYRNSDKSIVYSPDNSSYNSSFGKPLI